MSTWECLDAEAHILWASQAHPESPFEEENSSDEGEEEEEEERKKKLEEQKAKKQRTEDFPFQVHDIIFFHGVGDNMPSDYGEVGVIKSIHKNILKGMLITKRGEFTEHMKFATHANDSRVELRVRDILASKGNRPSEYLVNNYGLKMQNTVATFAKQIGSIPVPESSETAWTSLFVANVARLIWQYRTGQIEGDEDLTEWNPYEDQSDDEENLSN